MGDVIIEFNGQKSMIRHPASNGGYGEGRGDRNHQGHSSRSTRELKVKIGSLPEDEGQCWGLKRLRELEPSTVWGLACPI